MDSGAVVNTNYNTPSFLWVCQRPQCETCTGDGTCQVGNDKQCSNADECAGQRNCIEKEVELSYGKTGKIKTCTDIPGPLPSSSLSSGTIAGIIVGSGVLASVCVCTVVKKRNAKRDGTEIVGLLL